jgi:hypothetical protein
MLTYAGEALPKVIHNPRVLEEANPSSFFPHGIKIVESAPKPLPPPTSAFDSWFHMKPSARGEVSICASVFGLLYL